jgi:peptidoglycan/LPS O-acetylase OafA/YrhL
MPVRPDPQRDPAAAARVPALDGIRGIAILSVLLFHGTMVLGSKFLPFRIFLAATARGWLGVEVFFALSGFLITGILLENRHQPLGRYLGVFYFRRTLRIFPLYYGVILAMLLLPQVFPSLRGEGYRGFLDRQAWLWLYGANMAREYYGPDNPCLEFGWFEMTHFWTLSVEEHFYLLWPLVVYWFPPRALTRAALLLIGISIALRFGLLVPRNPVQAALFATPRYLSGLLIGALAAQAVRSSLSREGLARWARRTLQISLICLLLMFAGMLGGLEEKWDGCDQVLSLLVALATAAALVLVTLRPEGGLTRVLGTRGLIWFGTYSYGLYVYHSLWGPFARTHFPSLPGGYTLNALVYLAAFLAAPIALSVLSYHAFEKPLLKLRDRGPRPIVHVS